MRGEYPSFTPKRCECWELPPRARRIPDLVGEAQPAGGTTSACAENTYHHLAYDTLNRNYLRVRGEYWCARVPRCRDGELPPRARRIHAAPGGWRGSHGTTSACAENTLLSVSHQGRAWNYLRVRGEYLLISTSTRAGSELPPRARRIQTESFNIMRIIGTTSACAENTPLSRRGGTGSRNYLRVRGEYRVCQISMGSSRELPPRARRILSHTIDAPQHMGTTSACAENTAVGPHPQPRRRNYLRVRGEYALSLILLDTWWELPPRARRILWLWVGAWYAHGTTSACAENTPIGLTTHWRRRNYLRVRGEYQTFANHLRKVRNYLRVRGEYLLLRIVVGRPAELPPRARRIRPQSSGWGFTRGTTSACAENTHWATSQVSAHWNYLRVRGEYPK